MPSVHTSERAHRRQRVARGECGSGDGSRHWHRHSGSPLEAVFDLFAQPERTLDRSQGGLGIGRVEDNRDSAEMLATYLRAYGHLVRVAHDGVSGLDMVVNGSPDVVICDIGLPGMDGFELARRIRRLPGVAGIRLIAVTGYGEPRDKERGLQAGFDHYLVKPADPETLASRLGP